MSDTKPAPLTRLLRQFSFIIHCKLHNITPVYADYSDGDYLEESLQTHTSTLLDHNYINDLNTTESIVRERWAKLEPVLGKCKEEGFTDRNLEDLLDAVVAFGQENIGWRANLFMYGVGDWLPIAGSRGLRWARFTCCMEIDIHEWHRRASSAKEQMNL